MMMGPGGMPGMAPERMLQMMENPQMQRLVSQFVSNPDMIRQMQQQNPMLRQMVESNPMLRSVLNNPEMMRQFADPQRLRAALRLRAAMTGAPGAAGGMPDLSSFASLFGSAPPAPAPAPAPAPLLTLSALDSAFDQIDSRSATTTASMPNNDGLGSAISPAESPASAPSTTTPSPSAPTPSPSVATTTTATAAPAATTQYAAQLEQLHALGFVDDEENMRALRITSGDVNEAVGILLGGI